MKPTLDEACAIIEALAASRAKAAGKDAAYEAMLVLLHVARETPRWVKRIRQLESDRARIVRIAEGHG